MKQRSAPHPRPRPHLRLRLQQQGLTFHLHPRTRPPPRLLQTRHHDISPARLWQLSRPSAHQDFLTPPAPPQLNSSRWPRTNSRAGSSICRTITTNPITTTTPTTTAAAAAKGPYHHRPVHPPHPLPLPPPQERQQQKKQRRSVHTYSTLSLQKS